MRRHAAGLTCPLPPSGLTVPVPAGLLHALLTLATRDERTAVLTALYAAEGARGNHVRPEPDRPLPVGQRRPPSAAPERPDHG